MQIETFNHAEPIRNAQEKQARSYGLAFAENKKFVNSKFGAHLFLTISLHIKKSKSNIVDESYVAFDVNGPVAAMDVDGPDTVLHVDEPDVEL